MVISSKRRFPLPREYLICHYNHNQRKNPFVEFPVMSHISGFWKVLENRKHECTARTCISYPNWLYQKEFHPQKSNFTTDH